MLDRMSVPSAARSPSARGPRAPGPRFRGPRDGDALTRDVIGAAIAVHRALGPGLLESVYQLCLAHELRRRGMSFLTGVHLPLDHDGVRLPTHLRLDLLVENHLVVELKSVERLLPVHDARLRTYLRLAGHHRGLLINFNEARLVDGVRRFAT